MANINFNPFAKPLSKCTIPELKIKEGKLMQEIEKEEAELRKLNAELDEVRRIIREKQ